jgi:hypothetical protein
MRGRKGMRNKGMNEKGREGKRGKDGSPRQGWRAERTGGGGEPPLCNV